MFSFHPLLKTSAAQALPQFQRQPPVTKNFQIETNFKIYSNFQTWLVKDILMSIMLRNFNVFTNTLLIIFPFCVVLHSFPELQNVTNMTDISV